MMWAAMGSESTIHWVVPMSCDDCTCALWDSSFFLVFVWWFQHFIYAFNTDIGNTSPLALATQITIAPNRKLCISGGHCGPCITQNVKCDDTFKLVPCTTFVMLVNVSVKCKGTCTPSMNGVSNVLQINCTYMFWYYLMCSYSTWNCVSVIKSVRIVASIYVVVCQMFKLLY